MKKRSRKASLFSILDFMETKYYIILGIFSALVMILRNRNEVESEKIEKKKAVRIKALNLLDKFKKSTDFNHPISISIVRLLENYHFHENVRNTLSEKEIEKIEKELNLTLPLSYKIFLKYFGDGGDWIFVQYIDSIQSYPFLKEYKNLGKFIKLENEDIKTDKLLCLMTEDSNGGAWCWITHQEKKDNEWSLAYYIGGCLHYKVKNFTEWLNVVASDREVIREYDIEEKLGLG